MKKYFSTLTVVVAMLSMIACKGLLDEDPKYTINTATAFNTETSAQMVIDGAYSALIRYGSYGQEFYEVMVGGSGLAWAMTNGNDQDKYASLATTSSTRNVAWDAMYLTIAECNAFEQGIFKGSLPIERQNYFAAQALFIRALCYYNLINVFGDVPLRIGATTPDNLNTPRTPKAEVVAQMTKDWEFAAKHLSEKLSDSEVSKGIPSRFAASAYLAKLYFMLGSNDNSPSSAHWKKAKEYGEAVLKSANNPYSLELNFGNLFKVGENKSKEIIFQINSSKTMPGGMGNRSNWLFAPNSSTTGISWSRYRPTKSFYDQFKGTYPDDPRLNETFLTEYLHRDGKMRYAYPSVSYRLKTMKDTDPDIVATIDYTKLADPTNPTVEELNVQDTMFVFHFTKSRGNHEGWGYFKKCIDPQAAAQLSGKNIIVYRYADFLLLMADVYNELGETAEAHRLVNSVLDRARQSRKGAVYPKDWNRLSQTDFRNKLYMERLFELAGEPEMYMDVRRRGTEYLKKTMLINNNHNITKAFVYNATNTPGFPQHNFRDRIFDTSDNNVKKNLLLPIPIAEINTNLNIAETDQNFEY